MIRFLGEESNKIEVTADVIFDITTADFAIRQIEVFPIRLG